MYDWLYLSAVVLIAVVPQLGIFLWWGSNLSTRIKQLEADKERLYQEVDGINSLKTEIAVIKSTLNNQTLILNEIKERLK